MLGKTGLLGLATAATVAAQSATVVIEASHGGAGQDLTNTTINVPLNTLYTNPALQEVSTLFLTGASGADVDSITCTGHRYANGTGMAGVPFTSAQPALLSTNDVVVGSLTCKSNGNSGGGAGGSSSSSHPPSTTTTTHSSTTSSPSTTSVQISTTSTRPSSTSSSVTSSTSATTTSSSPSTSTATSSSSTPVGGGPVVPDTTTSILRTTVTPSATAPPPPPSTIFSTAIVTGNNGPSSSIVSSVVGAQASATSAAPSLNTDSAASKAHLGGWKAQGAMIVGLGLMAAF